MLRGFAGNTKRLMNRINSAPSQNMCFDVSLKKIQDFQPMIGENLFLDFETGRVHSYFLICVCIKILKVLDGYCGSGGFLSKSMTNMIQESNGVKRDKGTGSLSHLRY